MYIYSFGYFARYTSNVTLNIGDSSKSSFNDEIIPCTLSLGIAKPKSR